MYGMSDIVTITHARRFWGVQKAKCNMMLLLNTRTAASMQQGMLSDESNIVDWSQCVVCARPDSW